MRLDFRLAAGVMALGIASCTAIGPGGAPSPSATAPPTAGPGATDSPAPTASPTAGSSPTPGPTQGPRGYASPVPGSSGLEAATALAVDPGDTDFFYARSDDRRLYRLVTTSRMWMGQPGVPGEAYALGGGGTTVPQTAGATVSLADFDASGVVAIAPGVDDNQDRVLFVANGDCSMAIPSFSSPTDTATVSIQGMTAPRQAVTAMAGCGSGAGAHALLVDLSGNLYVGTDDGVVMWPAVSGTRFGKTVAPGTPTKLGAGKIVSLAFDRGGSLRLGNAAGSIDILDAGSGQVYPHSLSFVPVGLGVDDSMAQLALGADGRIAILAYGANWGVDLGGNLFSYVEAPLTIEPPISGARALVNRHPGDQAALDNFYVLADRIYLLTRTPR